MVVVVEADTLQLSFRDVMANVCTPVSVITAISDGRPHGTTVSAFASLSMDPPMVLVSLDRSSDVLALIRETGRFGVNVLASDQAAHATAFAAKGIDKGRGIDWSLEADVPRLPGATGFLSCQAVQLVEGGDHIVVLGLVVLAQTYDGQPLTYHARRFGTHAVHQ